MSEIPDYPLFEVEDVEVAFGANVERYYGGRGWDAGKADSQQVSRLLRDEEEIASRLFFCGGSLRELGREYRPGIDANKAQRALHAILCSFGVSHEQKTATAALAIHHWTQPIKKEAA